MMPAACTVVNCARGIFVRRQYAQDAAIIEHELVHWRQYRAMGLANFYAYYLSSYLIDGYANMEMEHTAWHPPAKAHLACPTIR